MMKKIILATILILPLMLAAQVTVNVQLPAAGMIQKDQLWNLVVVNNGSEMSEITVSLDLQDAVTGQTVLSGGSRSFLLGKGIKLISIRDVQPIQYNYLATELNGLYVPLGVYVACYRIFKNGPKGPEPLGDECVKLNINPLSPPLLNTPADKSSLPNAYPNFSWLPPSPMEMFSNLTYDLAVAEILPGQSPAEAILYNTPVYTNHNIQIPYENYPASFSRLKEGQHYAWQVTARNGFNYSAQTEVWSFVIKPGDSVRVPARGSVYTLLKSKQEASGIIYVAGDELLIKYYSYDKEHATTVRFLTTDGTLIYEMKQRVAYGDNFFRFKLKKKFEKGKVYALELTDLQKKIYSTRFSIN